MQKQIEVQHQPQRVDGGHAELEVIDGRLACHPNKRALERPKQLQDQHDTQQDAARGKFVRIGFLIIEPDVGVHGRAIVLLCQQGDHADRNGEDGQDSDLSGEENARRLLGEIGALHIAKEPRHQPRPLPFAKR